jgi:hypothetical protein
VNGAPAGLTWPTLNGTQFWSVAAAQGAMVRPTVTTAAVAAGGFDAEVGTVPVNIGSYDETVLTRVRGGSTQRKALSADAPHAHDVHGPAFHQVPGQGQSH